MDYHNERTKSTQFSQENKNQLIYGKIIHVRRFTQVSKNEPAQTPVCVLQFGLPENIVHDTDINADEHYNNYTYTRDSSKYQYIIFTRIIDNIILRFNITFVCVF